MIRPTGCVDCTRRVVCKFGSSDTNIYGYSCGVMRCGYNDWVVARQGPKSPTVSSITVMCPRLRVTIHI